MCTTPSTRSFAAEAFNNNEFYGVSTGSKVRARGFN
jgi:hypothetical protein